MDAVQIAGGADCGKKKGKTCGNWRGIVVLLLFPERRRLAQERQLADEGSGWLAMVRMKFFGGGIGAPDRAGAFPARKRGGRETL